MKSFRKLRLRKSRKVGGRNVSKNVSELRTRTRFTSGEGPPTPEEAAAAAAAAAAALSAAQVQAVANYKGILTDGITLADYIIFNIAPDHFLINRNYTTLLTRLIVLQSELLHERTRINAFEQQNPGSILDVSGRRPSLDANISELKQLAKQLNVSLPHEEEPLDGGRYRKSKKRRTLRRKSRYLRR
jgi:hypothetical protein